MSGYHRARNRFDRGYDFRYIELSSSWRERKFWFWGERIQGWWRGFPRDSWLALIDWEGLPDEVGCWDSWRQRRLTRRMCLSRAPGCEEMGERLHNGGGTAGSHTWKPPVMRRVFEGKDDGCPLARETSHLVYYTSSFSWIVVRLPMVGKRQRPWGCRGEGKLGRDLLLLPPYPGLGGGALDGG